MNRRSNGLAVGQKRMGTEPADESKCDLLFRESYFTFSE